MGKKKSFRSRHQIPEGTNVHFQELPTRGSEFHKDREAADAEFRELREELIDWQIKLYAEGRRSVLLVLQAMDAGGKDGTIRHVFQGVNPQGVRVTSFKAPSKNELSRDFLWRIHQEVPPIGMIGVFNRSHYEDVLVVRVDRLVPESVWRPRYEQINNFERLLTDTHTTIIKIYLHISREEQHKRFQERLEDREKFWKFAPEDLVKAKQWDGYMEAYEEMLERCSLKHAPWYVVPSDQRWYRNLAVVGILVETLREMDPKYPANKQNLTVADLQS